VSYVLSNGGGVASTIACGLLASIVAAVSVFIGVPGWRMYCWPGRNMW
jgi:hypothetical protein